MKKKIYWSMCLIALVAILVSAVMTTLVYYRNLENQMQKEVITEARYLEAGMDVAGEEYLNSLAVRMSGVTKSRVTVIADDGTVLFDNYVSADRMENHGERPEIKKAMESGAGSATRVSDTLAEKTFYYALRLKDGRVVRVANTTQSLFSAMVDVIPLLIIMAGVVMCLSMVFADSQTKRIVKPINELDLNHPAEARVYDELAPLLGKIDRQQSTIRQQMDTLRIKQQEFTAITENMSEGFIVVGKKGEVDSYNSSAMRIFGVEKQKLEESGGNVLNFNRSHIFRTAVDEALEGNHSEQNMSLGSRVYQVIANPVKEDDKVTGAIIVILDVTETQEREGLRREFTANVSHELKTPLTSISGYAEIMKNGLVKQEDMKRFSENIYTEAQRMITLIGDIIRLSQLDEQDVGLDKTSVDLYALTRTVVERLKMQARSNHITLNLKGEPQTVFGTVQILDEMINNLIDNGIKYNRADGYVNVTVSNEQNHPVLTVEDSGIGIPEEDQQRVFERFYRVDKSHSKQIGGTGLGLSIVKHGAIYHGAKVEMESTVGKGTKIRIIF